MNISALHIRNQRHSFWKTKNHAVIAPHSIIADKNDTAIFTIAGMQQFIPYLSGQAHPLGNRLADIQHCIRTNDIEEVGDNSHHTMFFMMGNRSLGDYFKNDAITRSYEFLTNKEIGLWLDPRKLAVTAFEWNEDAGQDIETASIWESIGIAPERISFLTAKDNRWSPGPVGPCGPCTEIYYRIGEWEPRGNVKDNENEWMEVWNNVFMEFYRDEKGLRKLEKQNVDTGMWFERLLKVLNNTESPYETELFMPIIRVVEKITDIKYHVPYHEGLGGAELIQSQKQSFRVIADHLRCATFLIAEGVLPSNESRGYVLRRLIRRAYYHIQKLLPPWQGRVGVGLPELSKTILSEVSRVVIEEYSKFEYIDKFLKGKEQVCSETLIKECEQFSRTLQAGETFLYKLFAKYEANKLLKGEDLFMLYDTHGFPLDIAREIAQSQWFKLDEIGFEKEMEAARERSRANTLSGHTKIDRSIHTVGVPATQFLGYTSLEANDIKVLKKIEFPDYNVVMFDTTPCYATMGWQDHDNAVWTDDDGVTRQIFDVQNYNGVYLHFMRR